MRSTAVASLLAACLLAAGCSGSGPADDALDQEFLDALVAAEVLAEDADQEARDEAVEKGRAWCETLTDPETTRRDVAEALAAMLRESELEASQRGIALHGTAAQVYCPEAAERLK